MSEDISIIIIGFDGYKDLWDNCIKLILMNWSSRIKNVIFVNNEISTDWDGVKTLHAGIDAEWSEKVKLGLRHANTDYICLLLEDFFISEKVDDDVVDSTISMMRKNNLNYVKLVDMNSVIQKKHRKYHKNKRIRMIKKADEYGISLQPSFWNKTFLEKSVGNGNYNAWEFEMKMIKESESAGRGYRDDAVFDTRNILNIIHGVIRGKFIPKTINRLQKKGFSFSSERQIMSNFEFRRIRFKSLIRDIIPSFLRKPLKRIMKKMGFKFMDTKSK